MVYFLLLKMIANSVQTGQSSSFQCKIQFVENGDVADCLIDSKNRRSCKKCRFEKCLAAGMKPNWVVAEKGGFLRRATFLNEPENGFFQGVGGAKTFAPKPHKNSYFSKKRSKLFLARQGPTLTPLRTPIPISCFFCYTVQSNLCMITTYVTLNL